MRSKNLDGVLILVSADNIFKVTKKAISYKIPIFLEKPLGLSQKETKIFLDLKEVYFFSFI